MDLQQLRYFISVATHGSISAGAAAVGVTQPTISQALQGLEHELRTPLFVRVGRGMVLTSAGYALLGPARRILRAAAAAREPLLVRGRGLAGRLHVTISAGAMSGLVPRLLSTFLRANRHVTVNARALDGDGDIAAALHERRTDIVFTRLPIQADLTHEDGDTGIVVVEIGASEILFAEPPGEPSPESGGVPWEGRGVTRRILAPSSDYVHSVFNGPLSASGGSRLPPIVAGRRETRLALVAAQLGATYIGAALAPTARHHRIQVSPLEPELTHRIGMIYDGDSMSPLVTPFVKLVLAEAATTDKNALAAGEGGASR